MFDVFKIVRVLVSHADSLPLFADTYEKYQAAKNAVQVVDAIVPAEYKVAQVCDQLMENKAVTFAVENLDQAKADLLAAANAGVVEGQVSAKKFFTPDRLEMAIKLVQLLAPLLLFKR